MAQNHVWRYTLRLFHTFSIFEKDQKTNAKREAESCYCRRRALTAAPLGKPANQDWWFGISPEGYGTLAMIVNFIVSLTVCKFTSEPPKKIQELVFLLLKVR